MATAFGRRRRRELSRQIWRVAPVVAAVCVLVSALNWWARGPVALPLAVVALAIVLSAAVIYRAGRRHAVSDAIAARIDDDGAFGGELRSAHWFAGREAFNEWADFHVDRAAERLSAFDWTALYPPIASGRSRVATAALLLAAIALAIASPGRVRVQASVPVAESSAEGAVVPASGLRLEMLPEDLRKQIEELLAAAEKGRATAEDQKKAIDIWNMFTALNEDINAEKLKELAKKMDPTQQGSQLAASKKLSELGDRALKAADVKDLPQDLRQALEALGMSMVSAAEAEQQAANEAQRQASGGPSNAEANSGASDGAASLDPSSMQISKDTDASAGAGMMMLSQQMGQSGNPAGGFGGAGNTGQPPNGGKMPSVLADALRRETVDASADTTGENVLSEVRRKTEHGQATVGFTHSTSGTSDRSRAVAPPPVPEDRRGTVQSYFTRKQ